MAQSKLPYQLIFLSDKKAIAPRLIKLSCVHEVTLKEYRHSLLKSGNLKSNG
ncbi:hypothetical protein H1Q63_17870 [Desmonostoc muscorum CCALA 125]|nr:hypothetical protein [Desmonostoc muscorum CCALA 125]